MPNIFNLIKPRGTSENARRNNFDLLNGHVYSQKAGIIDALKCVHTIPKDYFDIDLSDATQTTAMNAAAFMRATKEISCYYVPYNYLWSNFNQYQATREDPKSAALAAKGIKFEPRVPIWYLYKSVAEMFYGYLVFEYYAKLLTLIDMRQDYPTDDIDMGSVEFERRFVSVQDSLSESLYPDVQQQYYIFATDTLFANEPRGRFAFSSDHTPDRLNDFYRDICGNYKWSYACRKLDMLGYGNLLPVFDSYFRVYVLPRYESWIETIKTSAYDDLSTLRDELFNIWIDYSDILSGNMRWDFTRYVMRPLKYASTRETLNSSNNYKVSDITKLSMLSAYPLYAYNHIFYYMFRNSYFDLEYDIKNYNLDFKDCTSFEGSIITYEDWNYRFFELAHHQFKKDMFTGVLPDVQFGVVSSVSIDNVILSGTASLSGSTGSDLYRWRVTDGNSMAVTDNVQTSGSGNTLRQESDGNYIMHTHLLSGSATLSSRASIPNAFDVLALRRAEMLQVYHQQLMRAGNRTSDIFKAIYGSDPKSEVHGSPYFVDVLGEDMNLDPVVATANTGVGDNPNLGDIAARGLFNGQRSFKFSTDDFGCLMFLGYVVPEPFYNSTRIDPHLMNLSPEQHFIPELMDLGFSPVIQEWLCNLTYGQHLDNVRGYAPPYLEFKTDISLAHGSFVSAKVPWSTDGSESYITYRGSLSHWVSTRLDMQSDVNLRLRNFYINPSVLDSIFKVSNDDTYETDNFICRTAIVVKAVRQLSQLGLPQF